MSHMYYVQYIFENRGEQLVVIKVAHNEELFLEKSLPHLHKYLDMLNKSAEEKVQAFLTLKCSFNKKICIFNNFTKWIGILKI